MLNDSPVLCRASLRAKPGKLAAIWLFLIILPVFLLSIVTEKILQENEEKLAQEIRLHLAREIEDFRDSLSFSSFVDLKMTEFSSSFSGQLPFISADQLAEKLQKTCGFMPAAIFSLHGNEQTLSLILQETVKADLRLVSRTMMKNILKFYCRPDSEMTDDLVNSRRFRDYLKKLICSTGDLRIKSRRAMPAISGKPDLGRLLLYFLPARGDSEMKTGHLLIFRERDIPLAMLLESSMAKTSFKGFRRGIFSSNEGRRAIYRLSENHMKFFKTANEGLLLYALPSTEFLLRAVTDGTLYPSRLDEIIRRMPILKVCAPPEVLSHPMRPILRQLKLPAALLVIVASIIILHLHFFGFGGRLKIGTRLFISVMTASILPFSTFIAASAWHQRFLEDFSRAEIRQFIQLHADQISRTISASLNSLELKIVGLSKDLADKNFDDSVTYLTAWIKQHAGSMGFYREKDRNETVAVREGLEFDEFESEMKLMGMLALQKALEPEDFSIVKDETLLGMVSLKSRALSIVLESVGKLHRLASYNLSSIYATFPVFTADRNFSAPKSIALVKFDTRDLLKKLLGQKPELMQSQKHGNYLVQKCFIPLILPDELPPPGDILHEPDFPFETVRSAVEKIARNLSSASWTEGETSNVAIYLHHLSCILVIKATPLNQSTFGMRQTGLLSLLFFVILVTTLVAFLRRSLVKPIYLLKNAADKVAGGDFSQAVVYRSGDEFENLTAAFSQMSADLLQKERLSSYVSEDVIQEIESGSGTNLQPGGERIEVAVFFVAMAGFKDFRRQLEPEAVTEAIGNLIDHAAEIVDRYNGRIDKLIEDTLMLVFRQRGTDNSHVESACRAALGLAQVFKEEGRFRLLAGIASGPAVSGKIGSRSGKLDYTVIGNPVNLAARLKAQAGKAHETGIIVCPNTIRMLRGLARLRFIERTEIKGRSRTFPLYELLELRAK